MSICCSCSTFCSSSCSAFISVSILHFSTSIGSISSLAGFLYKLSLNLLAHHHILLALCCLPVISQQVLLQQQLKRYIVPVNSVIPLVQVSLKELHFYFSIHQF